MLFIQINFCYCHTDIILHCFNLLSFFHAFYTFGPNSFPPGHVQWCGTPHFSKFSLVGGTPLPSHWQLSGITPFPQGFLSEATRVVTSVQEILSTMDITVIRSKNVTIDFIFLSPC